MLLPKWWNTLSFRYFCWKQLKRSVRAAVLSVYIYTYAYVYLFLYHPKISMSPENGPCEKELSSEPTINFQFFLC